MKKMFASAATVIMLIAAILTTSCSTAKSVNSSFAKNGYTMTVLTPQQQYEVAPIMNAYPRFNHNAMGYLVTGNAVTFVYAVDQTVWDAYSASLEAAGFSNMGTGFVKVDKTLGVTYNISSKFTTIYKQTYLLVTFTHSTF